ncbi:MAG: hypothetical protein H6767_04135 [Candidatus Peribacteria bacterium]|nr:MAG: hypothetical protein H6767_04135 [Candidatus Peribacteria bacterium]
MLDEHRISSISLYDEYGDMVEELFLQPEVVAEASFDVSDMDEFEIRVRCNLHGVWGKKFQND